MVRGEEFLDLFHYGEGFLMTDGMLLPCKLKTESFPWGFLFKKGYRMESKWCAFYREKGKAQYLMVEDEENRLARSAKPLLKNQ